MIPLCRQIIKRYDKDCNLIEVIDPAAEAARAEAMHTLLIIAIVVGVIITIIALYLCYRMFTGHDPTNPTSF